MTADVADPPRAAREAERFGAIGPPIVAKARLTVHVPAETVASLSEWLRDSAGATSVTVSRIETLFSAASPAYDRLIAKVDARRAE